MVIKQISKLVLKRGTAVIYDDLQRQTQWISNGRAFYHTYGLPTLDVDSLLYVLDIPEKKQEKVWTDHQYAMPGSLNFSDYDDTERELPRVQTTVGFEGDVWMPVRTSLGLMFIDPAYLKPLKDLDTEPELKERQAANGEIYIAVKRGMELKAVILPIYQGEPLLEELETLTKELRASISRRKMMEQVDPETGEVVEEQNDDL